MVVMVHFSKEAINTIVISESKVSFLHNCNQLQCHKKIKSKKINCNKQVG